MEDKEVAQCLKVAEDVARRAGEIIRKAASNRDKVVMTKDSRADFVTETDKHVEEVIIGALQAEFPTHSFIGEESTAAGAKVELTDKPTWCIDPIDGTTNFIHCYPSVAVSIGLLVNKIPCVGIIYNPLLDQMFMARKGHGAFLNGKQIKVSEVKELNQALVISEFGGDRTDEKMDMKFRNLRKVIDRAHGIRSAGSAACNMAAVAAGYAEVYYEFGLHCWDMAAGIVIVQEAGGVVMDPSGGEIDIMSRKLLAVTNTSLAAEIMPMLEIVNYERD